MRYALIIGLLVLVVGCKGKEGPVGAQGTTGTPGAQGSGTIQTFIGTVPGSANVTIGGTAYFSIPVPGLVASNPPVVQLARERVPADGRWSFSDGEIMDGLFLWEWAGALFYIGNSYKLTIIE